MAGKPDEAAAQFAMSLSRHMNRAASLLGKARAASKGDRSAAAETYAVLAGQWKQADAQSPGVQETNAFLKEVGGGR